MFNIDRYKAFNYSHLVAACCDVTIR